MEDVEDDDNIDLEELQAQINLSLAETQSLVASWIDPSYGASTSKKDRTNSEREIEELLKRPPRLGVGASVPASTSIRSVETVKLKGKLAGKKRPRDEDTIVISSHSEEEEESRSGAIKKKARIDPFEGKGKRKAQADGAPKKPPSATAKLASVSQGMPESKETLSARPATTAEHTVSPRVKSPEAPSTGKKKKRRKNKKAASTEVTARPSSPKEELSTAKDKAQVEVIVIEDSPPHMPKSLYVDLTLEASKTPERGKPSASNYHKQSPGGLPLLNLDGPPPAPPVPEASPSRKKRKRRKKKKSDRQSHGTGGGDAMDVDQEGPIDHSDTQEDE